MNRTERLIADSVRRFNENSNSEDRVGENRERAAGLLYYRLKDEIAKNGSLIEDELLWFLEHLKIDFFELSLSGPQHWHRMIAISSEIEKVEGLLCDRSKKGSSK